jgi:hypothetical protein
MTWTELLRLRLQVLLATCHEDEPLQDLRGFVGKLLCIQTTAAGTVTWEAAEQSALGNGNGNGAGPRNGARSMQMEIPKW